jgi:hypothetical protein
MTIRKYAISPPVLLGLGLLALAGCAQQPTGTASLASAPALQPGTARLWVLRQPNAPGGNVAAADPMVFANSAPLAQSAQGTVFFHDFQPGTYRLTVQAYGTPANLVDTVQLAPERRPMFRSRPCPTGKWAPPREAPVLPC